MRTKVGEDVFLFAANGQRITTGNVESDAEIAAILQQKGRTRSISLFAGTSVFSGDQRLSCDKAHFDGSVKEAVNRKDEAYFVLEGDCPKQEEWKGHTLIVTGDDGVGRPYQIVKSAWVEGQFRAYTRSEGVGLPAREGKSWHLPNRACAEF